MMACWRSFFFREGGMVRMWAPLHQQGGGGVVRCDGVGVRGGVECGET